MTQSNELTDPSGSQASVEAQITKLKAKREDIYSLESDVEEEMG